MSRIPSRFASRSGLLGATLVSLLSGACDSGSFQGEIAPCPCDGGACSAAACPIEVALDSTCTGEFALAEVLVGDHVEAGALLPEGRLTTCSKIEPGETATIWVRGGPWIWGPLQERCERPGETRSLVLQCIEAR